MNAAERANRERIDRLLAQEELWSPWLMACGPGCRQLWQLRNPRERPALF